MADRLFIIDGMAYAFRAFYAIRANLSDSKGRPTNAVFGFTRMLLKILREQEPTHIAMVFDAPGKTFRDEIYPEYKANRSETPPELKEQFPIMHEVVEALNIPLFVVPGVEADDVIGTLAKQATAAGMDTVLVSGDKDLLQLVDDQVKVFDPKGDEGKWYGREEVLERFGTEPEHVIDALALMGDSADNIPGVRGIGEKTAKKLMEAFGSLEALYARTEELKGKQKEKIEADKDAAFFSRDLVTIKTDVPLDTSLDALVRQAFDRDTVIDCFGALNFTAFMEELIPDANKEETPLDYRLVTNAAELDALVAELKASGCFAVDTETTATDPMQAALVGLSFCCEPGKAYYIPVGHQPQALTVFRDPDDLTSVEQLEQLDWELVRKALSPLLEDPEIGKVGHNIKYDRVVLQRAGITMAGIVMDTMVASYLTDPSRLRHNLNEVSLQYLRRKPTPISDLIGKGSKAITFDHVPIDRACMYAAEDADLSWRLYEVFQPRLEELELSTLFQQVELPLIEVLARMEERGIAIDMDVFDGLREEIEAKLAALEAAIHSLAGEAFNINSPKQLQGILFDKLGLKPLHKTKTGYSTDVEVLEHLAREHPLPEKILEYRTLEKLRGTYVEALPKLRHPETGRIHTSFNQAVAATGRLSSSDPNLQNIPVRTEYGRRIRSGFVPGGADQVLISADYSQVELRIMAHLSQDTALLDAFKRGMDIHRDTAARVFEVAPDDVDAEMRRQAKAVNFGVVYGISAFGLARNLGISRSEAAHFIDAYFSQYPDVRRWLDETLVKAKELGYVATLLNRRRYLPELKSADPTARKAAERAAINAPVQGSAADIIKLAMVQLEAALEHTGGRILLQVHDELLVEAPKSEAETVAETTRKIMQEAVELDVSLKVDIGIGMNWAEIH